MGLAEIIRQLMSGSQERSIRAPFASRGGCWMDWGTRGVPRQGAATPVSFVRNQGPGSFEHNDVEGLCHKCLSFGLLLQGATDFRSQPPNAAAAALESPPLKKKAPPERSRRGQLL